VKQPGLSDLDRRHKKLLIKALKRSSGAKAGRPAHDAVLMFKVLVLQALYNLSDEQTEYQILDRLSVMTFLGLLCLHHRECSRQC
jgi:IS5 family transposase